MADAKNGSWKRFDAEMKWYERIRDEVMAAAEEAGVSMRQQLPPHTVSVTVLNPW